MDAVTIGTVLAVIAAVALYYKSTQLAKSGMLESADKHKKLAMVAGAAAAGLGFMMYRRGSTARQYAVTMDDFDFDM